MSGVIGEGVPHIAAFEIQCQNDQRSHLVKSPLIHQLLIRKVTQLNMLNLSIYSVIKVHLSITI